MKINISVDTDTKKISVDWNGKTIENVQEISVYHYEDYNDKEQVRVSVMTTEKDEETVSNTFIVNKSSIVPVQENAEDKLVRSISKFLHPGE